MNPKGKVLLPPCSDEEPRAEEVQELPEAPRVLGREVGGPCLCLSSLPVALLCYLAAAVLR